MAAKVGLDSRASGSVQVMSFLYTMMLVRKLSRVFRHNGRHSINRVPRTAPLSVRGRKNALSEHRDVTGKLDDRA